MTDHALNGAAVLLGLPGLFFILAFAVALPLMFIEWIVRQFVPGLRFGPLRYCWWHRDGEFYPFTRKAPSASED